MNRTKTNDIAKELKRLGFKVTGTRSNILWFAKKDYDGSQEYRDENKNLCRLNTYLHVWFEAGINTAGVGDGRKPNKALTYSIGLANNGTRRNYRCKEHYSFEHLKFYNYSRNLKTLIENFKQHLVAIA